MKAVKLTTTLFLVFSLFLISSCEKSNLNEYPDFEGTWLATENYTEYKIIVKDNGKTTYEETTYKNAYKSGSYTGEEFSGKLIIDGNEMKIGFKKLTIDSFPKQTLADNIWRMTLDGIEYERN
jgi:hypothetical protein